MVGPRADDRSSCRSRELGVYPTRHLPHQWFLRHREHAFRKGDGKSRPHARRHVTEMDNSSEYQQESARLFRLFESALKVGPACAQRSHLETMERPLTCSCAYLSSRWNFTRSLRHLPLATPRHTGIAGARLSAYAAAGCAGSAGAPGSRVAHCRSSSLFNVSIRFAGLRPFSKAASAPSSWAMRR